MDSHYNAHNGPNFHPSFNPNFNHNLAPFLQRFTAQPPSYGPPPAPPHPQEARHHLTLGNLLLTLQSLNIGNNFALESEHHGNRFVLFKFRRDDGSRIALRVQHQYPISINPEIFQNIVRREVFVLKKLESIRFGYAPRCLAFDLSFNNPLRHPFLVVTWAEGRPAAWDRKMPTMNLRMRMLTQLFELQLELIHNSLESREETAKEFYTRIIHERIQVAPDGPPGVSLNPTKQDYWNQLNALDGVLGHCHDDKNYAIAHNNLLPENIIVDKDYNIECIIGWSSAGIYPLGQAAILPRIIAPDTFLHGEEASQAAFKAIGDKIKYSHELNLVNLSLTPAKQAMKTWQNDEDADFRALYMLSTRHRDVLVYLARYNWNPPYIHRFRDVPPSPRLAPRPMQKEYEPQDKPGPSGSRHA